MRAGRTYRLSRANFKRARWFVLFRQHDTPCGATSVLVLRRQAVRV